MDFLQQRVGRIVNELRQYIEKDSLSLKDYVHQIMDNACNVNELPEDGWQKLTHAIDCGGDDKYHYFRTRFEITKEQDGQPVIYHLGTDGYHGNSTNPQYRLYVNGEFSQGMDENHRSVLLTECAKAGDAYEIIIAVYNGKMRFKSSMSSHTAVLNRKVEKLFYDILVPHEVLRMLDSEDKDYRTIITALNDTINLIDFRLPHSEEFYQSIDKAQNYIDKEFYEKRCNKDKERVCCIGHTHIDIAWLWTIEVAKDKAVRSFGTVLKLMEEYPEYKFISSQPHLYKAIKEREPKVYEEIKQRIKEGRWEADGGMFVEADCNLSGGEALVRQFMYGIKFFEEEFDAKNEVLWLPDVFGYSAALPQIMQQCGIKYFMTTKISWNETNKMPYDTFMWKGLDGTEVLTHFVPASDYDRSLVKRSFFTTYNANLNPSQIKGSWSRYQQKGLNEEVLMSFGYGDGGGGPTKEMLENQRRLEKGIPGCPATVIDTAKNFFHRLEEQTKDNKNLPTWDGELYLEYHRGTYTSMARNKKYNRKAEFLLHNIEAFAKLNSVLTGAEYPKQQIDEWWEVILRNQFHDILPGSSIHEVYEVSKAEYDELFEQGSKALEAILMNIANNVKGDAKDVVVFNPNGFEADGVVEIEGNVPADMSLWLDEEEITVQQAASDKVIAHLSNVPAVGYSTLTWKKKQAEVNNTLVVSKDVLENDFYRILINEKGQFSSVYDKRADRELIAENKAGNVLMTYEDKPHNWDAWDINDYYTEKAWEVTDVSAIEVVEEGPVRGTLKIEHKYLNSTITQYIQIYKNNPRIDFKTEVDWKETHVLLKTLFNVDIHSSEATFDIQYGNVKRATHYNTSWDKARFEVNHHKWLDLSEDDYGVSLLNDCKYGCHVHDDEIGLTLLKSAKSPNETADREFHTFTYSLYPHQGDFKQAETVKAAYVLNNPLVAVNKEVEGNKLDRSYEIINITSPNVVLEVVKEPEVKGDHEEMVLRFYECFNRRTKTTVKFAKDVEEVVECNMLEKDEVSVNSTDCEATLEIKPYEIKTWKVRFMK